MIWLHRLRALAAVAALTAYGATAGYCHANTLIGNWESGTPEGWIDWSSGQTPLAPPRFQFNSTGATVGSGAVQFNLAASAYTQWLSIKLQQSGNGVDEWRDDFLSSVKLAMDLTLVASEQGTAPTNDFANIGLNVNAQGYGFTNQGNPESVTPFVGFNGGNSFNPRQLPAGSTQTSTWVWDIADTHDGIGADIAANPGWIELILETYSNGPVVYHVDNVRLIMIPEPGALCLVGLAAPALLGLRRHRGRRV